MKINGNAVKPGMIVEHKGELWVVNKSQSVKPGKGGAFNQVEMKISCLLYTSPSPRDKRQSRMPSSA